MKLVFFFRQNICGSALGAGLCGLGFALFFFTLGYGASCPEAGPEICTIDLTPFMWLLYANTILFMSIWAIMFFAGQQILLMTGVVVSDNYSESFFATTIMPSLLAVLTMFFWGVIGGLIQIGFRKIRK